MNSKPLTVIDAAMPVPYIGHITDHPFTTIVKDYLESISIDPDLVERQAIDEVVWSFCTQGVSVAYRLYKDNNKEVFLHVECAFGIIPEGSENEIAPILLQEQYHHHYPIWHAINEDRLAVVMFRSYCGGITEAHFLLRLDTIIKMGVHCREVFSKVGIKALPTSWFNKKPQKIA